MNLVGNIFLVSGTSSGIGKSCAELLLNEKSIVIGLDIEKQTIQHKNYEHIVIDIRNEKSLETVINDVILKHEKIDGLVNCAGVNAIKKPFYELSLNEWNNTIAINLTGTFLLSKYIAKYMIEQKKGKIVNISCIRTKIFKKNMAEYATTKGGIVALTSSMAIDLAPYNIQVNSVAPGLTYTNILRKVFENKEGIESEYINLIPQKKIADPEDIANVILFLLSKESNYITGQTIYVDGGISIEK